MDAKQTATDVELDTIRKVYLALNALDQEAQQRVVEYVCSLLGFQAPSTVSEKARNPDQRGKGLEEGNGPTVGETEKPGEPAPTGFSHLAELFEATSPKTEAEKALVGAYWLQVYGETEGVEGLSINKELKHLGQGVSNITRAIDVLKKRKPALMMQLRKSGKSKQARKTYRVTHAGVKLVREMMNG